MSELARSRPQRLFPASISGRIKEAIRTAHLTWALSKIRRLPAGVRPNKAHLSRLRAAWGNVSYSARLDFLHALALEAVRRGGPVVECGSGLSSILLGAMGERGGIRTWSLEHSGEWADLLDRSLDRFGLDSVTICRAPLTRYGSWDWYNHSNWDLPEKIKILVVDGPPESVRGGRYGALPILGERLGPDSVILVDDAKTEIGSAVIDRWVDEFKLDVERCAMQKSAYARLTFKPSTP